MIWQSVICCIAIFNLALIHKRNIKKLHNFTVTGWIGRVLLRLIPSATMTHQLSGEHD